MARKRMLDPSLWTDDGMAELSPRQQLLYIGLISNADDDGRLKASPVAIRLILPTVYANVKDGEIDADLTAVLRRFRQLVAYIAEDRRYLVFLNYRKWQRIEKPSKSVLPAPPDVAQPFDDHSTIIPRTVDDHSTIIPAEVNRREVKGIEEKEEARDPARADEPPPPEPMIVAAMSEVTEDTPYAMVAMFCEERGKEIAATPADWRSAQLGIAKQLLLNHSIEQVRAYVRYRITDWNGKTPFDLRHVIKDIGAWELAGSPPRASPNGKSNGTVDRARYVAPVGGSITGRAARHHEAH